MFDVIILALGLSMDAFAVSIGLGSKKAKPTKQMALLAGVYFGIAQGVMPLFGYLGGRGVFGFIADYANWIGFGLLMFIGGKMIFEALSEGIEEDIAQVTHRVMLMLAIATSIDALAAGFTLTLIEFNALLACVIIGLTTLVFSAAGVVIGEKTGSWLESKAEIFGGVVLILIGFKILLF